MVTKKIRTEYMKKFRDPRWDTFSKCYEDSVKYRLTRRVMEHSHKPWFWEGWDSSSESSGWSTPKLTRNKVAPLSLPPSMSSVGKLRQASPAPKKPTETVDAEEGVKEEAEIDAASPTVLEDGVNEASVNSLEAAPPTSGPSDDTGTDNGPADTQSSDGEPLNPPQRQRHRRRTPRSKPGHRDSSHDDQPTVIHKPPRAKSQPAISTITKENRRASSRLDLMERQTEVKRTPNDSNTSNACVQTRRQSNKRGSNQDRRRAQSADLEKMRRSQLTVVDDRWMTEYMRCFSARLR